MKKRNVEKILFKIGVHIMLVMFILGVAILGVSKFGYGHGIDIIFGLIFSVLGFSCAFGLTNASIKFKLTFPVTVMLVTACGLLWYFTETGYVAAESFEKSVQGAILYMVVFGLVSLLSILVGSLINLIVNKIVKKVKSVRSSRNQQIKAGSML